MCFECFLQLPTLIKFQCVKMCSIQDLFNSHAISNLAGQYFIVIISFLNLWKFNLLEGKASTCRWSTRDEKSPVSTRWSWGTGRARTRGTSPSTSWVGSYSLRHKGIVSWDEYFFKVFIIKSVLSVHVSMDFTFFECLVVAKIDAKFVAWFYENPY